MVFISEPNANAIPGVRVVPYRKPPAAAPEAHVAARELDGGVRRAEVVARTAANLKQLGFTPDIIIGHHGWGELLNLPGRLARRAAARLFRILLSSRRDRCRLRSRSSRPIRQDFPRIRAKNAINHIALNLGGHGQTPTEWQFSTYPAWAQQQITLLREGVQLDICKPNPQVRRSALKIGDMTIRPADKLVTYVSRDLEPYRGFHLMMRALPHLLRARKDVRVVMIGGDGVSYGGPPKQGTWREVMMKEVGDGIDPDRVVFPGRLDYQTYLRAAATLRRACLSDLPVRRLVVVARVAGDRLRGDRQRHAAGARVRHRRRERIARLVLRSSGPGTHHPAFVGGHPPGAIAAGKGAAVRRTPFVDGRLSCRV